MRSLISLPLVALMVVGAAGAASAESGKWKDETDGPESAAFDIDVTKVNVGTKAMRFRVKVAKPTRETVVLVEAQMYGEPGHIYKAIVARGKGKSTRQRLYLDYNTVNTVRVRCPGLRAKWRNNQMRVRIPNKCINGARTYHSFGSATYPGSPFPPPSHYIDRSQPDTDLILAPGRG